MFENLAKWAKSLVKSVPTPAEPLIAAAPEPIPVHTKPVSLKPVTPVPHTEPFVERKRAGLKGDPFYASHAEQQRAYRKRKAAEAAAAVKAGDTLESKVSSTELLKSAESVPAEPAEPVREPAKPAFWDELTGLSQAGANTVPISSIPLSGTLPLPPAKPLILAKPRPLEPMESPALLREENERRRQHRDEYLAAEEELKRVKSPAEPVVPVVQTDTERLAVRNPDTEPIDWDDEKRSDLPTRSPGRIQFLLKFETPQQTKDRIQSDKDREAYRRAGWVQRNPQVRIPMKVIGVPG